MKQDFLKELNELVMHYLEMGLAVTDAATALDSVAKVITAEDVDHDGPWPDVAWYDTSAELE